MTEPLLTERFDEALAYARHHHRGQLRKGTPIPYFSHLMSVAALNLEMGEGDEDEAIAALLHDVIEDGGGHETATEIERHFGPRVRALVEANTDAWEEPKPDWRPRKETYIAGIATKDPAATRISLADKLHNARAILADFRIQGDKLWKRFKAGEGESARWYYRTLADAFEARRGDLGPGAQPMVSN